MNLSSPAQRAAAVLLSSVAAALLACGGPPPSPGVEDANALSARTVTVTVSPSATSVQTGATVAFSATVSGTRKTAVTWSVLEAGGGTIDQTGRYQAPAQAGTYHVRARSQSYASSYGTATVTVTSPAPAVSVAVSPAQASLDACTSLQLTAAVAGTTDTAVTWAVAEGAAGGTVSTSGLYTAPSTAGSYHVVATSHASATAQATATVTVRDHVLSVTVAPAQASAATGGTVALSASVVTTCGTFASP